MTHSTTTKMRSQKKVRVVKMCITYGLLVLLSAFFAFPFLWVLSTSLKGPTDVFTWPPQWIPNPPTTDNYTYVFQRLPMLRYFWNTMIITFMGIALNVGLAALAAYPLARFKFRGRDFIFAIILLPMMIPMQGSLIVNFITINSLGLFNTYLAVVLPSAVSIFGIFLMRQHYRSIPKELEDAGRIDGCNEFQLWWKVMLPMVKPATTALAIFSFAAYWNSFLWPLIVLKDPNKYPLQVGLSALNSLFMQNFRHISASIVVSMIPILIFFFFTQRFFIEGYQGAIKQ